MSPKHNTMAFEKRLALNRLRLPLEVVDIVKDFAFYDVKGLRYKKAKESMLAELKGPASFQSSGEDKDGCWAFQLWLLDSYLDYKHDSDSDSESESDWEPDPYIGVMIAASNCGRCGNYTSCYSDYDRVCPKAKCRCAGV
jgi:hypothetical protein